MGANPTALPTAFPTVFPTANPPRRRPGFRPQTPPPRHTRLDATGGARAGGVVYIYSARRTDHHRMSRGGGAGSGSRRQEKKEYQVSFYQGSVVKGVVPVVAREEGSEGVNASSTIACPVVLTPVWYTKMARTRNIAWGGLGAGAPAGSRLPRRW